MLLVNNGREQSNNYYCYGERGCDKCVVVGSSGNKTWSRVREFLKEKIIFLYVRN